MKIEEVRRMHEERILRMANAVEVMIGYKVTTRERTS